MTAICDQGQTESPFVSSLRVLVFFLWTHFSRSASCRNLIPTTLI